MQQQRNNFRGFQPKKPQHRINNYITSPTVRVVGDGIGSVVISIQEALKMAEEKEVDLVEISPKADPPVCKLIDYSKFLYEKKKEDKARKQNTKQVEVKEIRMTQNIDEHDLEFKSKHAKNFLTEGNKVRVYVQFKGREIVYKERAELVLLRFVEMLDEEGSLEYMPKMEGKKMHIMINPKKKK